MIRLDAIDRYTENNRIEAKRAAGGLPHSLWETYSAFANTFGGIILLGVEELPDYTLQVSGLTAPEQMLAEFWDIVKEPKYVSANILSSGDAYIRETEKKRIIVIEVPRANRRQKPVYLGEDPFSGTYRRCGEGDYHCTPEEVRAMLRDRENDRDKRILQQFSLASLDMETVARYRQKFFELHPGHDWHTLSDGDFLEQLGAVRRYRNWVSPTAAGLLMFGREPEIMEEFPGYFLDYREKGEGIGWTKRVMSGSGDWSGNLCDFYFCVFDQVISTLTVSLGRAIIGRTSMQEAIREALANAVIHADYDGGNGLVIERSRNSVTITNPGSLRVSPDDARSGSVTDQRNSGLAQMFALVGVGHGKGGGLRSVETIWEQYQLGRHHLREQLNPDTVTLRLTIETDVVGYGELRSEIIEYLTDHIEGSVLSISRDLRISKQKAEDILRELTVNGVVVPQEDRYRLKR